MGIYSIPKSQLNVSFSFCHLLCLRDWLVDLLIVKVKLKCIILAIFDPAISIFRHFKVKNQLIQRSQLWRNTLFAAFCTSQGQISISKWYPEMAQHVQEMHMVTHQEFVMSCIMAPKSMAFFRCNLCLAHLDDDDLAAIEDHCKTVICYQLTCKFGRKYEENLFCAYCFRDYKSQLYVDN